MSLLLITSSTTHGVHSQHVMTVHKVLSRLQKRGAVLRGHRSVILQALSYGHHTLYGPLSESVPVCDIVVDLGLVCRLGGIHLRGRVECMASKQGSDPVAQYVPDWVDA